MITLKLDSDTGVKKSVVRDMVRNNKKPADKKRATYINGTGLESGKVS